MPFNSIGFAVFLPVVFLSYWFVFNRYLRVQNLFILLASYFFYGWWDWRFLILVLFTSLVSYGCGLLIEKHRDAPQKTRIFSTLNIVVNLMVLGAFKYYDFFATSFANAFMGGKTDGLLLNAVLPVGISFYTFKALSYGIDIYRGKLEPTRDIIQYFTYIAFFPQLLAGPIERATNLLPQLARPRTFDYATGVDGMRQIVWGLFKKMVVADGCAVYVDTVFQSYQTQGGSTLLLAALLYTFQIYGDFSGYSDVAIGTGKLFGFQTMRNFSVPYFSRNIAEFWRRWHISLTTWFRDYVYIPMGGSRCSKEKIVRNTFIIFLLSGLWHGANWTFLAWGTYHALLFLPLILLGKNRKYRDTVAQDSAFPTLKESGQMVLTFFLVVVGWVLFRADSIGQALDYFSHLVSKDLVSIPWLMTRGYYLPLFLCLVLMVVLEWVQRTAEHGLQGGKLSKTMLRALSLVVSILVLVSFLTQEGDSSFIYFQF